MSLTSAPPSKTMSISVATRPSSLALIQTEEILNKLKLTFPKTNIAFKLYKTLSRGDLDLKTPLKQVENTDFFCKEINDLVLKGTCRIAIHSAKDLPLELSAKLEIIAITKSIHPADSLVTKFPFDTKNTPKNLIIGTSSERRERIIKKMFPSYKIKSIRGTIQQRLALLDKNQIQGIIIAKAALMRLNISCHELIFPPPYTPLQGSLAVVAKQNDLEMKNLFSKINNR